MSLSDCRYCWDTPCTCGYEYRNHSVKSFAEFIAGILSQRESGQALEILDKAKEIIKTKE